MPRPAGRLATRRHFLAAMGGTLAFPAYVRRSLAGSQPIRFGLTPVFLLNDLELLDALRSYLGTATGHEIELVRRRTYQEVTALLVSGQLDAAWICGYPYVRYKSQLELIATPEWNGRPYYRSYLIVAADRRAQSFEDLRGDIHAFSDPDSNSGFLVTRHLLFEHGLEPETFFRKTMFTYAHRNVIRAVGSGLAQSGSVDGYVWEVVRETEPDLVGHTRPLRMSEWLGFPPICASKLAAGTDSIRKLTEAFVSMKDSLEGRSVLALLRLTGFAPADDAVFDGIAAKYDDLRGVL